MATPTTNPPPWAFGTILTHVLLLPALSVCSSLCHDHPPPLPAICQLPLYRVLNEGFCFTMVLFGVWGSTHWEKVLGNQAPHPRWILCYPLPPAQSPPSGLPSPLTAAPYRTPHRAPSATRQPRAPSHARTREKCSRSRTQCSEAGTRQTGTATTSGTASQSNGATAIRVVSGGSFERDNLNIHHCDTAAETAEAEPVRNVTAAGTVEWYVRE